MMEQAKTWTGQVSLRNYLADVFCQPPLRVRGTAVFLSRHLTAVPHALINNLEHNGVLHDKAIFLTVTACSLPYVATGGRLKITPLEKDCFAVTLNYGFKDEVSVPADLGTCTGQGLPLDPVRVSYFLSHALVVPTKGSGMMLWREQLFAATSHNIRERGGLPEVARQPGDRAGIPR